LEANIEVEEGNVQDRLEEANEQAQKMDNSRHLFLGDTVIIQNGVLQRSVVQPQPSNRPKVWP
jgi:hypothetical protein